MTFARIMESGPLWLALRLLQAEDSRWASKGEARHLEEALEPEEVQATLGPREPVLETPFSIPGNKETSMIALRYM